MRAKEAVRLPPSQPYRYEAFHHPKP
jgi:hypothetical protein